MGWFSRRSPEPEPFEPSPFPAGFLGGMEHDFAARVAHEWFECIKDPRQINDEAILALHIYESLCNHGGLKGTDL